MKEALLVCGVPDAKLERKSVVSSVINCSTWLGGGGKKIIKAFRESAGGRIWINEGVCGVNTDDEGLRFYDLAGSDQIGKGGWATPSDSTDNNLWYEPTASTPGPVIHEFVEELYGTWTLQTTAPYEATASKNEYPQLIEIGAVAKSGDDFTVSYRTEGVKNVGTKVKMSLFKWDGSTWVFVLGKENGIALKWDNAQAITFTITADGTYTVTAKIIKPDGSTPYPSAWSDTTGPVLTRP